MRPEDHNIFAIGFGHSRVVHGFHSIGDLLLRQDGITLEPSDKRSFGREFHGRFSNPSEVVFQALYVALTKVVPHLNLYEYQRFSTGIEYTVNCSQVDVH